MGGPVRAGEDWSSRPVIDLLEHIEERFHEQHRHELPELVRLAGRVEEAHATHPACPHGLSAALKETLAELEMHMRKEEEILFPMLRRGMGRMAGAPIAVMRAEHEEHLERLRRLASLAHGLVLPADACGTWRVAYAGLQSFIDDVTAHIALENDVLFPRVLSG